MIRNNEEPVGLNALDRVTWALRRAELAVQSLKEQRLRPLGLMAAHYTLLISVHDEPGLTGAELARRLNVTPQAIASLVARLESRGQLERREHPRHRHVQELHLTDAGRESLSAADKVIAGIELQVADSLGPKESTQLRALLNRVTEAIRED
ncbi:MarR family transcriptional regulator [Streptomyces europaeiscabiei]|uniref:MarR family winged helix-turn-helix transcriptional regulator n=1 Tax=Streptomyces TaxID=1883 RepID=UPI000A3B96F9|nr:MULTISPECIES: MarR family transcriptional regulator [Streptomyces]MDX3589235.1 MarR family transcriptional regulator [Streptomyces europaeiscabiei]MDX3614800.1 MarR family transcriptional regulator [Streptomyces europaeiscabiei]MDX3637652.1 MarR family transcriptional regulator [Streptomyces europaeiscabiei]MDX3654877.1 MarR family transcriptional regulator [Streptomyces europaeiscabiei]WUD30238.1 MarR family transcriptional regulator [Streptomyces europaeiscabiei]